MVKTASEKKVNTEGITEDFNVTNFKNYMIKQNQNKIDNIFDVLIIIGLSLVVSFLLVLLYFEWF
jgi:hypothetical protein